MTKTNVPTIHKLAGLILQESGYSGLITAAFEENALVFRFKEKWQGEAAMFELKRLAKKHRLLFDLSLFFINGKHTIILVERGNGVKTLLRS